MATLTPGPDPPPLPRTDWRACVCVFVILLASYAFFWQARDWNCASRLMLTYALVDRGTVSINGLEDQTGDKAYFQGRYYCDKLPGFSLLAVPPYALERIVFRLPPHPVGRPGFPFWPADYGVTLATSGLLSALTGALLAWWAGALGCGPRRSALVGLAYGLGTPAYAYATLSYGHQASAFALMASFAMLWRPSVRWPRLSAGAAGVLAAWAAVIEMQVGPVAAVLGFYLLAQTIGGRARPSALAAFGLGAAIPTLVLLGYNLLAFGSPWDMGYFHHAVQRFRAVHSAQNPIGLRAPQWPLAIPLLWGGYRGLLFYAPIAALAVLGWAALLLRRSWGLATVTAAAAAAIFLVNLSYPEWTGGWSTGPRLLVPALPFLMLPVAGLLAGAGRWATVIASTLAVAGSILMTLFLAVGARIPETIADPLRDVVWPLWRGAPLPPGWPGDRFARNLVSLAAPERVAHLPAGWQWVQFVPLAVFQVVGVVLMVRSLRRGPAQVTA